MSRRDPEGPKVGARLLAGRPLIGAPSSQTNPPGGSLVSSKPVSGEGSSVTASGSGWPACTSTF